MEQEFLSTGRESASYRRQGKFALTAWLSSIGLVVASTVLNIPSIAIPAIFIAPLALYGSIRWFVGRMTFKEPYQKVKVDDTGVTLSREDGETRVDWQNINAIYEYIQIEQLVGGKNKTHFEYSIVTKGDDLYSIDDQIGNIQTLGTILKQKVQERLFPLYAQQFQAGQEITLGDIRFSKYGIAKGQDELTSWDDIKSFQFMGRDIMIFKKGRPVVWLKYSLNDIPNPDIFLQLTKDKQKAG